LRSLNVVDSAADDMPLPLGRATSQIDEAAAGGCISEFPSAQDGPISAIPSLRRRRFEEHIFTPARIKA
jgi:hypothetical protein